MMQRIQKRMMMTKKIKGKGKREKAKLLIICLALFLFSCKTSENKELANASPSPTATVKQTTLQDDLKFIENANFQYVYVFRRKDGEKFDSGDVGYLKDNAHPQTNQWLKSEEGKTVIAGSNFKFDKKMLDSLKKRFTVEDLSPKVEETEQNTNTNR